MSERKQYVPTTLDGYLNESKSFMLKRGYGQRKPVIAAARGAVRDQVLPFVAENKKVSGKVLRKFIAGLNENGSKPAAVNMWLKRNSKYFVAESKNGETFYTLSKIGRRLVNRLQPITESKEKEADHDFVDTKKGYERKGITSSADAEDEKIDEAEGAGKEIKQNAIEKYLASKKKKMYKKSEYENVLEGKAEDMDGDGDIDSDDWKAKRDAAIKKAKAEKEATNESEARKERIAKLLEEIREKESNKLNEEEEEDELTFDDLDLGDEESEEEEGELDLDLGDEAGEEKSEDDVEDIEISEFILTVDDPEAAIAELEERGITAEVVSDESDDEESEEEEGEEIGDEESDLFGEEDAEAEEDAEEAIDTDGDLSLEEADESEEEAAELDFDLEGDEESEEESEEEVEEIDFGEETEEDESEGQKIKVSADHAEELVKYLEEKGVDVEEMFGGQLDIEGSEEEESEGEEPAEDVESAEEVESEEDAGGEEEGDFEI